MRRLATLAVLLLATVAGVEAQGPGSLTITGTSTVRDWQCAVADYRISVRPAAGLAGTVLEGREAVETLTFVAAVDSIDCGIGKMNEHLRKALKSEEFPGIRFDLGLYDVTPGDAAITVRAEGTLTIAGVTRPVELQAEARGDGEALRVTGMKLINMEDYGVKPPSLMLGTLKVDKQVHVEFDVPVRNTGLAATLGSETEAPN